MYTEDLVVGEKYSPRSNTKKVFEFVKLSPEGDPCFKCLDTPIRQHRLSKSDADLLGDSTLEGLTVFETVKDFRPVIKEEA